MRVNNMFYFLGGVCLMLAGTILLSAGHSIWCMTNILAGAGLVVLSKKNPEGRGL